MTESINYIPNRVRNAAVGGHVCGSVDIIDDDLGLEQHEINKEVAGAVPYNQSTPNGMGRIVLKKNDNFKEVVEAQTNGNTIFVIKYDYVLNDTIQYDNITITTDNVVEIDKCDYYYTEVIIPANKSIVLVNIADLHFLQNNSGTFSRINKPCIAVESQRTIYIAAKKSSYAPSETSKTFNNAYYFIDYVTIPSNCILEFDGGTISKGTIVGTKTIIKANIVKIFGDNVEFDGNWNCDGTYPEWFGAKGTGLSSDNDAPYIQKCYSFGNVNDIPTILTKVYTVSTFIYLDAYSNWLKSPYTFIGRGGQMIIYQDAAITSTIQKGYGRGVRFEDINFNSIRRCLRVMSDVHVGVYFDKCTFSTPLVYSYGSYIQTWYITNCFITRLEENTSNDRRYFIDVHSAYSLVIDKCDFEASHGGALRIVESATFKITNSLIEDINKPDGANYTLPAIYLTCSGRGLISGCYFEENRDGEIYAGWESPKSLALNIISCNFSLAYASRPYQHIYWWLTSNSRCMSLGNIGLGGTYTYEDSNHNQVTIDYSEYGHKFREPVSAGQIYINDRDYTFNTKLIRSGIPTITTRFSDNKVLQKGTEIFDESDKISKIYDGNAWRNALGFPFNGEVVDNSTDLYAREVGLKVYTTSGIGKGDIGAVKTELFGNLGWGNVYIQYEYVYVGNSPTPPYEQDDELWIRLCWATKTPGSWKQLY